MFKYIGKSILLIFLTVVICCGVYPAVVWIIGQTMFPFQANGSMVDVKGEKLNNPDVAEASGQLAGSLLIAQPFTKDEYFQPRPSNAGSGYDASASSSSAIAPSNYALRARVASTLGPIVTYRGGPKAGQPVAPDIEAWFQKDQYQGSPSIVQQWADLHNGQAQAWVGADPSHAQYITDWTKTHQKIVDQFIKDNPGTPQPQPSDLAVVFFENFSKEHPGMFPSAITPAATTQPAAAAPTTQPVAVAAPTTQPVAAATPAPTTQPDAASSAAATPTTQPVASAATAPAAAPATVIGPVNTGSDIQSNFFDMWRQDHADADLQDVPGDMVTTSGSGLDPHITLQNAEYQLDRIAPKWATDLKRDPAGVRKDIEQLLQDSAAAPLGGLAGEKIVNVLELNLSLRKLYGPPPS